MNRRMPTINIGLDGEFMAINRKGVPTPTAYNIPSDAFDLLAEIRSSHGTPGVAYGTFMERYAEVKEKMAKSKLRMSMEEHAFDPTEYWENVLRCSAVYEKNKEDIEGGNIHGHKMRHTPVDGKIYRGGGLHIHI